MGPSQPGMGPSLPTSTTLKAGEDAKTKKAKGKPVQKAKHTKRAAGSNGRNRAIQLLIILRPDGGSIGTKRLEGRRVRDFEGLHRTDGLQVNVTWFEEMLQRACHGIDLPRRLHRVIGTGDNGQY